MSRTATQNSSPVTSQQLNADQQGAKDDDICVYIFTASAALVGVCLTVIGLFRTLGSSTRAVTIGDDLLALDGIMFLAACILSYIAIRIRRSIGRRHHRLERTADIVFVTGLVMMALICGLIAYEVV